MPAQAHSLIIRKLGLVPYGETLEAMKAFTTVRDDDTIDEFWVVQHRAVFTQGQAGKAAHIINSQAIQSENIQVIQSDRGGQITYHGPGQLVVYTLVNLKRQGLGVRALVSALEQAVVDTLTEWGIAGHPKADAPGVYVGEDKICSLGLRVKKQCSYHGLALNINMDLTPFSWINPCGYQGMKVTQASALAPAATLAQSEALLIKHLMNQIGYNDARSTQEPWSIAR